MPVIMIVICVVKAIKPQASKHFINPIVEYNLFKQYLIPKRPTISSHGNSNLQYKGKRASEFQNLS